MDVKTGSTVHQSTEYSRRIDLLGFMFKYLHYTFLGPSQETMDSTWKRRLYSLVQFIMLFSYIPALLCTALGLYEFRHDIRDITDMLVTIVPFLAAFPCGFYFIRNWDQIKQFMVSMETDSYFTSPFVHSKDNLLKIIEDTKKKCVFLTKFLVIAEFIGLTSFFFKPFILSYLEDSQINLTEEESIRKQWKNMIYVIWLPVDPRKPLVFYSVYIYQLFTALVFFCHSSSVININFVLIRYSAVQFTLTCKALSQTDILTSSSTLKSKNEMLINEYHAQSEIDSESQSFSGDLTDSSFSQDTSAQKEKESDESFNYVRQCIILHQSAISFATEMNALLSPLIVMYLLNPSFALVVSSFQFAMGGGIEKNMPYFWVSVVSLAETFALCWFGQKLIDESLAVEQAVYNMQWYYQSSSVKEIVSFIIMRAQNAVELKETGFPNVSIATFSMIINASYQWFTVLLNMLNE
ncbi:Odorant receptor 27 [Blattella germanica]|nr:Odorant receptor 27 [Blattella germanica]